MLLEPHGVVTVDAFESARISGGRVLFFHQAHRPENHVTAVFEVVRNCRQECKFLLDIFKRACGFCSRMALMLRRRIYHTMTITTPMAKEHKGLWPTTTGAAGGRTLSGMAIGSAGDPTVRTSNE